jgi:hypothetical protein
MPAIQNQQTGLTHLLSINGTQITEHNRKIVTETQQSGSSIELSRGINRRYIKKNKKTFKLSFTYLPNGTDKTVDGRAGRDFLKSISNTRGTVTVSIKLSPIDDFETYTCFVNSYTEKLVRRDIENSCSYYDVTIDIGEQ